MTKGKITVESVAAIANAIREKLGTTATYKPAEMAPAILSIPTGAVGEEIPKVYVPKNLEHQNIVITPKFLNTPDETGDKKAYTMIVSTLGIKAVPVAGYEAGNIVINGIVMGKEVDNYTISGGEQITATAATKIGDSPTLDIQGTLTLTENDENTLVATSDKINTTSDGYQVSHVEIANIGEFTLATLTVNGISAFYNKPGIYTSTIIKAQIGDVTFDATREMTETISGGFANADFLRLKANVGTPINFSIKYE